MFLLLSLITVISRWNITNRSQFHRWEHYGINKIYLQDQAFFIKEQLALNYRQRCIEIKYNRKQERNRREHTVDPVTEPGALVRSPAT